MARHNDDTMESAMPPNPVHELLEAEVRPEVNDVMVGYRSASSTTVRPTATGHFLRASERVPFIENAGPMLVAWNLPEKTRARLLAALRVAELDAPIVWIMNDPGGGDVVGLRPTDHGSGPVHAPEADPRRRASRVRGWDLLSDRERSIAYLIGEAMTNRQIAQRVFLSPHTVNYYLRRIFKKLGINSRVELAGLTRSLLAE